MKPANIDEYILAAVADSQDKLRQLHECILAAAPGATQGLKWRMPAYSYEKILVTFAVFKHHIGFYPMASAITAFDKELSKYKTSGGGVQFPLDKPLPILLIKKMVKFRVQESKDGIIKWRS